MTTQTRTKSRRVHHPPEKRHPIVQITDQNQSTLKKAETLPNIVFAASGGSYTASADTFAVAASHSAARQVCQVCALLAFLVGTLVMIGWAGNVTFLTHASPNFTAMSPITACGFVLAGAALWFRQNVPAHTHAARNTAGSVLAVALLCLGVLRVTEYVFGAQHQFDWLLFSGRFHNAAAAPQSSACFALFGLGLLLLDTPGPTRRVLSTVSALLVGVIALLALLGYTYNSTVFYSFNSVAPIALHTALALALLSVGLLCARPDREPVATIVGTTGGGATARRLLAALLVVPFIGWLRLEGQHHGFFRLNAGEALYTTITMLGFACLIWASAHAQGRIDKKRKQAEEQVRDYSYALETRTQELEKANLLLETLATRDGLTNLTNHRAFQEKLEEAFAYAQRFHTPLSLLFLDVDLFKVFNDTFGHLDGDEALRRVAEVLKDNAREVDTVARYGGEEFAIILPHADRRAALHIGERLRAAIASGASLTDEKSLTVSVGAATLDPLMSDKSHLVAEADRALYLSKHSGRNQVTHSRDRDGEQTGGSLLLSRTIL